MAGKVLQIRRSFSFFFAAKTFLFMKGDGLYEKKNRIFITIDHGYCNYNGPCNRRFAYNSCIGNMVYGSINISVQNRMHDICNRLNVVRCI